MKFSVELEDARRSLESAAAELPWLEVDDLMYRRRPPQPSSVQGIDSPWYPSLRLFRQSSPGDWPSEIRSALARKNSEFLRAMYQQAISRLIDTNFSSESLVYLARDARPDIRTLAMALLFDKEEPKLLRYIADNLTDSAKTFPALVPTDNLPDPIPTRPQTVGEVARLLVGAYLVEAGMSEMPNRETEAWLAYERSHRDRPYYLSWSRCDWAE